MRVYIDTNDWWIGYYRGDTHHYVCPLPAVVIRWNRHLCGCWSCIDRRSERAMHMVVCPICGNKRCPKANNHRHACTGSNEPGQVGSAYPNPMVANGEELRA